MQVNDNQKKAMSDIIAAMNRATGDAILNETSSAISPPAFDAGSDEAKKKAMGNIMKMFRSATENIREDAQDNPALMEAFRTERTSTGVRMAEWEIVIAEHAGRLGKFYNVHRDDIVIASDLRLYEAAFLLTRELNNGVSITSPKVRKILHLEEEFAKNLDDAARFAQIVKVSKGTKKVIAEARLSDARSKAILAKDQIKSIR